MSVAADLQAFTAWVRRDMLGYAAKGIQITRVWTCPEGMATVLRAATMAPCEALDIIPETRVHGIPMRESPRMPRGKFWYVLKGVKE